MSCRRAAVLYVQLPVCGRPALGALYEGTAGSMEGAPPGKRVQHVCTQQCVAPKGCESVWVQGLAHSTQRAILLVKERSDGVRQTGSSGASMLLERFLCN